MRTNLVLAMCMAVLMGGSRVHGVPLDSKPPDATHQVIESSQGAGQAGENVAVSGTPAETPADAATASVGAQEEQEPLETSASEEKGQTYVGSVMLPDNLATAASTFDPSVYAGLLPDAFQQYIQQYGGPYAPGYTGYPAPIGYAPAPGPVYPAPSPYVVQTGYEGYLVPTTTTTTTSTAGDTGASTSLSLLNPLSLLTQLFPALMTSVLFRIFAAVVSAVGMIFMGGVITTAICNLTPLCDISFRAVTYLKRRASAEHMGRMIAEEMTPERVRRATEFVRNAIRKYRELQKLVGDDRSSALM